MKITLTDLDLSETNKAWSDNRAKLRVEGTCLGIYKGSENNGDYDSEITKLVPYGYFISSVEVYANGCQNVFLRRNDSPKNPSDKLIQVRG